MRIVEELAPRLPAGYVAEPRVHLGSYYEIDICAFEQYDDANCLIKSLQGSRKHQPGQLRSESSSLVAIAVLVSLPMVANDRAHFAMIAD